MEQHHQNWYAVITAKVLYADNITPRQKLLVAVISNLLNAKGKCFASNAYFAKMMNVEIRSIQRDLAALVEAGYITKETMLHKTTNEPIRIISLTMDMSTMTHPHVKFDTGGHVNSDTHNNIPSINKENSGRLSEIEVNQLCRDYKLTSEQVHERAKEIEAYYVGRGIPIKSLYSMMVSWLMKDAKAKKSQPAPQPITYQKLT